jgi:ADP-ribose pyrophosphatase YjhB (NUDIX family)
MGQMYKVFVNDCPIILTENEKISTNLEKVYFDEIDIRDLVNRFLHRNSHGICLLCNNLGENWLFFQSLFEVQKAAGGKVLNSKGQVLFIYRDSKWDLPKGKLEKEESIEHCALREVAEECGVTNLKIDKPLALTYHIFRREGRTILKVTHWFLMHTNFTGTLTPQIEESITKSVFKGELETREALKNSYENIKLLFD